MKQTKYRRLRVEDRAMIYSLKKVGKTQTEISAETGFSQPTISKELSRNTGFKGYRHKQARDLLTKDKSRSVNAPEPSRLNSP